MAEGFDDLRSTGARVLDGLITGQQAYHLEVPGTASAAALSVVSFEAVERMGEPYTVTIQLTHPLALDRADYLNRDATFLIGPADGSEPRKFAGCAKRIAPLVGVALLVGCAVLPPNPPDEVRNYDVPPQVIYRIDDHRFISLENYRDCHHGTTYYNDTRQGIRTKLATDSIENYQGRLINADPSGRYIVIPSSEPPTRACPERGCNISFIYSTDGGRSFMGTYYMRNTWQPFEDSADYIVAATEDRIYIAQKWGSRDFRVEQYPLIPDIDLRKELPPGIKGDRFRASDRPGYLKGLRTPSGQEYLSCDDSIRPKNLPAKK